MIKVKTFTNQLQIFRTAHELEELDREVNKFIEETGVSRVIAVSDTTTAGEGDTVGIIRVLTYEK